MGRNPYRLQMWRCVDVEIVEIFVADRQSLYREPPSPQRLFQSPIKISTIHTYTQNLTGGVDPSSPSHIEMPDRNCPLCPFSGRIDSVKRHITVVHKNVAADLPACWKLMAQYPSMVFKFKPNGTTHDLQIGLCTACGWFHSFDGLHDKTKCTKHVTTCKAKVPTLEVHEDHPIAVDLVTTSSEAVVTPQCLSDSSLIRNLLKIKDDSDICKAIRKLLQQVDELKDELEEVKKKDIELRDEYRVACQMMCEAGNRADRAERYEAKYWEVKHELAELQMKYEPEKHGYS